MKVYVLLHNYSHEGSELVDVYKSIDTAYKEASRLNDAITDRGEDYSVSECELIED